MNYLQLLFKKFKFFIVLMIITLSLPFYFVSFYHEDPVEGYFKFKTGLDQNSNFDTRNTSNRFAYVFYITNTDYGCYALINAHRLVVDLKADPKIDIQFLATESSRIDVLCPKLVCPAPLEKVKIKIIPSSISKIGHRLAEEQYFKESYVRFEAFGLYDDYDRIVIIDADGFVLRNLDHLFQLDLEGHKVGAAYCHFLKLNFSRDWLSSILLVVEPTERFYNYLHSLLNDEGVRKVSAFAGGHHYDMDMLNFALDKGNSTKILSRYYVLLDRYFLDDKSLTKQRETELDLVYYLHFSYKKPLMYSDTRPINPNSGKSIVQKRNFQEMIYYPFWKIYDSYCKPLKKF